MASETELSSCILFFETMKISQVLLLSDNQRSVISGSSLTNEDDEAVVLLWGALVQRHLLIRGGQSIAAGRACGAGLTSPLIGRPPPEAETPTKAS